MLELNNGLHFRHDQTKRELGEEYPHKIKVAMTALAPNAQASASLSERNYRNNSIDDDDIPCTVMMKRTGVRINSKITVSWWGVFRQLFFLAKLDGRFIIFFIQTTYCLTKVKIPRL